MALHNNLNGSLLRNQNTNSPWYLIDGGKKRLITPWAWEACFITSLAHVVESQMLGLIDDGEPLGERCGLIRVVNYLRNTLGPGCLIDNGKIRPMNNVAFDRCKFDANKVLPLYNFLSDQLPWGDELTVA